MKKLIFSFLVAALAAPALLAQAPAAVPATSPAAPAGPKNPVVVVKTSMGAFKVELFADKAPVTVANYLQYVKDKFYDGLIFHRVINGFMIQGGGFDAKLGLKATRASIKNEAKTGVKNEIGTIAMARTADPNSANSQFYVNVGNNQALDYRGDDARDIGYCAFGKVVDGMDVVNKIKAVPTGSQNGLRDVPLTPVVIESIRLEK